MMDDRDEPSCMRGRKDDMIERRFVLGCVCDSTVLISEEDLQHETKMSRKIQEDIANPSPMHRQIVTPNHHRRTGSDRSAKALDQSSETCDPAETRHIVNSTV
jgi:hypothetical protein